MGLAFGKIWQRMIGKQEMRILMASPPPRRPTPLFRRQASLAYKRRNPQVKES